MTLRVMRTVCGPPNVAKAVFWLDELYRYLMPFTSDSLPAAWGIEPS